jgi:hypothetical protein
MRPDTIRDWLREQPFQPFRIHLTNGAVFDIRHPDQAIVTQATVIISLAFPSSDGVPTIRRDVTVSLIHNTHLEPIVSGGSSSSN